MSTTVTFWGTRGSIPTPGRSTLRYGGNTSCVAVETAAGNLIVFDAGTGIRGLGNELVRRHAGQTASVELFISHTHWDHIQGLPFFAPLFRAGTNVRIRGPAQPSAPLDAILRHQMSPAVFPVPLSALDATLAVTEITTDQPDVAGFDVGVVPLCHPGTTLGFGLSRPGKPQELAYVTDNELGAPAARAARARLVRFLRGCRVLVHDGMYFEVERKDRSGWGHSTAGEAVELALEAECERLVLFHHDPDHDDVALERLLVEACELQDRLGGRLAVELAQEGSTIRLEGDRQ